jgi:hypothetical protein
MWLLLNKYKYDNMRMPQNQIQQMNSMLIKDRIHNDFIDICERYDLNIDTDDSKEKLFDLYKEWNNTKSNKSFEKFIFNKINN